MYFSSIDDCLGPGGTRFFGGGYRRVRYAVEDTAVTEDGASAHARAAIHYPADWSTKAGATGRRAHLSSIDALILGADIATACVAVPGWVRRVDIKAGTKPYEDGLDRVRLAARRRPDAGRDDVAVVDCRVGPMRLRCEIAPHSTGTGDGPLGAAYYRGRQTIRHVVIDTHARAADAQVTVDAPPSMIDGFVIVLQLAQALLYELDGVDRASSSTLWMRSTTVARVPRARPSQSPLTATARLSDAALLTARGSTWRTATIDGACDGVSTRCAVAHELPYHAMRSAS